MRIRIRSTLAAALAMALLTACGAGSTGGGTENAEDYPSKQLDWTIAFGPGGGNDIMARTMVDILKRKKLYPEDIRVENKDGGSGATGWGYVFSKRGDGYSISTTSGSFLTTPLQAKTGWTWKDFTPVGLMATDNSIFLTDAKGGIKDWDAWVEHAKEKGTVKVGGIGTVNVDLIMHAMLAQQAGYKIDYVSYNEEGQLLTSLSSGALDAIVSNPSEVTGQIDAKKMNALLYTGKKPLPSHPGIPTGESLGYKNLPTTPRGLILAPDAPEHAQKWWIDNMKKVVATPEWKAYLKKNDLTADERWGDDFTTYLQQTSGQLETKLREQGALK